MTILTIPNNYHVDITLPVIKRNGFGAAISYLVQGLPEGVTYNFSPSATSGIMNSQTVLTIYVSDTAVASTQSVTVTGFPSGKTALLFTLIVPVRSAIPTTRAPATLNIIPPLEYTLPSMNYSTPFTINANGWSDTALNFIVTFSNPAITGNISNFNGNYQLNISNTSRVSGNFTGNLVLQNNNTYTSSSVGFFMVVHPEVTVAPTAAPTPAPTPAPTAPTAPPTPVGAVSYISNMSNSYIIITGQNLVVAINSGSTQQNVPAGDYTYTINATDGYTVTPVSQIFTVFANSTASVVLNGTVQVKVGSLNYFSNMPNSYVNVTGASGVFNLGVGQTRINVPIGSYSFTVESTNGFTVNPYANTITINENASSDIVVNGVATTSPPNATVTPAPVNYGSVTYQTNMPNSVATISGNGFSGTITAGSNLAGVPTGNYTFSVSGTDGFSVLYTNTFTVFANQNTPIQADGNPIIGPTNPPTNPAITYGKVYFNRVSGAEIYFWPRGTGTNNDTDLPTNNANTYYLGDTGLILDIPVGTYTSKFINRDTSAYSDYTGTQFTVTQGNTFTINMFYRTGFFSFSTQIGNPELYYTRPGSVNGVFNAGFIANDQTVTVPIGIYTFSIADYQNVSYSPNSGTVQVFEGQYAAVAVQSIVNTTTTLPPDSIPTSPTRFRLYNMTVTGTGDTYELTTTENEYSTVMAGGPPRGPQYVGFAFFDLPSSITSNTRSLYDLRLDFTGASASDTITVEDVSSNTFPVGISQGLTPTNTLETLGFLSTSSRNFARRNFGTGVILKFSSSDLTAHTLNNLSLVFSYR